MKKNKVFLIVLILIFITTICIIDNKNKTMSINEILSTNYYTYLPDQAKEYIQDVYEETGEVLKTEKNKERKQPYLNPEYVTYLSLSQEEQREYDVIPEELTTDYVYSEKNNLKTNHTIPESFDLRNVNGKNYTTPVKDQAGLGLCWAFGTYGQIESLLLIQNNQTYTEEAEIFSERQIDYATANNGLTDHNPLYQYNRILGDGGNFQYATSVMIDGLGLVDTSWKVYDDDDYESMEMNQVYNFYNSKYEVTGTITYPDLDLASLDLTIEENQILRKNYLNNLKSLIMEYGGSYIGTADPTGKCSVSLNGSRFMYDDGQCASAGHAMQVIGWDDNYEYSVCSGTKDKYGYYHINTDVDNCQEGTIITGKGAWILKNSWGKSQQYVYIAYDSYDMTFGITTSLAKKDWDNYYSSTNTIYSNQSTSTSQKYTKQSAKTEQLNKIKFTTGTQDATYNIYIATDSSANYKLYRTITNEFPGIHTVDLKNENIYLEDDEFYIKIVSSNGRVSKSISVYTNNVENVPKVTTYDTAYENSLTDINKYIVRVYSDTVGISEKEQIQYKVLDSSKKEITAQYTYTENIVFANKIFSKLFIDPNLPKGNYTLQTIYNNEVLSESNIEISKSVVTIEGSGIETDPYIIKTPAQLGLIKFDAFAFYKLGNDIDLTYDTTNENGLFYNEGKGWDPIKYTSITTKGDVVYGSKGFSGGFDGDNHKIIGLTINRPDESSIGLFANTYNQNFSNLHIKNIILESPNIIGNDFVGGIVGYVNGTTYERCLNISNISVHGGTIKGNNHVGSIAGYLRAGSYLTNYYVGGERHKIDNLYNSATIEANDYAGGIFGYVTNITGYKEGNSIFQITNILNKGNVTSNNNAGGLIGKIKTAENNYISIYNAMNTGKVEGIKCTAGIVCRLEDTSVGELKLSNIYYIDGYGITLSNPYIKMENISTKKINELKDINLYSSWIDFDTNWQIETIDGIKRLPILKSINFEYTSISLPEEISSKTNNNLYDYVIPSINAAKNIKYTISDPSIATINNDGLINPKEIGITTIYVESYYDGYQKELTLNITEIKDISSTVYTIDSTNKYIYVPGATLVETFYSNVTDYTGKIELNKSTIENGYVGTGMKIDDYIIIVRGDVTGDGRIRANDVMKISAYTVEGTNLDESYNKIAADVTNDGSIRVNDVMKISKYTVEGGSL